MIIINTAPAKSRILLDGNNTVISITSSNGFGHYFRALIYINGTLFDTQSWSRKNEFTAEKDLKKLYNAYFESIFESAFTSGINEQTHLLKTVSIIIQEKLMSNDNIVQSVSLPEFYIMYNNKPVSFLDTTKIQFLGLEADKILMPVNGKITVPFFANTNAETVLVTLKDNFNSTINSQTILSSTAKKVFLYNYDLSDFTFSANTTYFILSITVGSTTITKAYRYLKYPDFEVKEIAFLNNYGYYVYAYLDGQMSSDNLLEIDNYDDASGSEKTIEINEECVYTINTGSLIKSEKAIIKQIVNSLDFKLSINSEWINMVSRTKKIKDYQDRLNNYSESLSFGVKLNATVYNNLLIGAVDPEIIITGVSTVDGNNYSVEFTSNFTLIQLFSQENQAGTWSLPTALSETTSPLSMTNSIGGVEFILRLFAVHNGEIIYSNEFIVASWP
jgi:hypothetical protein